MIKKNYQLPVSYHLGSMGCGCAGEPPGHPRYFVRSIYTRHGNSPRKGSQYYLNGIGFETLEEIDKLYGKENFPKLSLDHPRTRAWIKDKYRHFKNCYYHPTEKEYNRQKIVIYPVPSYELKKFFDDKRYNNEIKKEREQIAIPENHCAVVLIRKHYPEYQPELNLIENPPVNIETWWERLAEKPLPENCPGSPGLGKHPVNGKWCQVCGWHEEEL